MLLGVCGYGFTGSGAVIDLLKEYPDLLVCDKAELQEAFKIDGLQDLEYHLTKQYTRHMSGDVAILRFKKSITYYKTPIVKKAISPKEYLRISNKFVDSLIQGSWWGIDNSDYNTGHPYLNFIILLYKKFIFPWYEKITGQPFKHWPARKMYLSIQPDDFYKKAVSYTDSLIKAITDTPNQTVVFDQIFEGNAPEHCFPLFRDPKAIVVDRDPRDLFLIGKYAKRSAGEARFMPREDVTVFVEYYKRLRMYQKKENTDKLLFVRFEDLIYNYEETIKQIENFVGCHDHKYCKKYFNPDISINNTQLFNNPKYQKSLKEIQYIEKNLSNYLFDFDNYKKLDKFRKTF